MIIELDNVSKKYGKKKALDQVNFVLNNGLTALIGNNGAGKSTLIGILVGLIQADSGRICFDGMDCVKEGKRFRSRLGFLPQECGYYDNYSCLEFMNYMADLKAVDRKNKKVIIEKYLKAVNLWDDRNKAIKNCSGGMKHRLGIAQAMLNEPDILILDEPTTGLDYNERQKFRRLMQSYAKDHIVFVSTHVLSDIDGIADKVMILKDGRIVVYEDVSSQDSIAEKYRDMLFEKEE